MFGIEANVRDGICGGIGFVIACLCPAIGRRVKAVWVKLTTKAESALEVRVKALEAKIVKDGSAAVSAVEAEAKKA